MSSSKQLLKNINQQYWARQQLNNNSMLGGYNEINTVDIQQSEQFMKKHIKSFNSVLELGCGVGRVTEQLLSKYFKELHLIEREFKFVQEVKKKFSEKNYTIIHSSVEDYQPLFAYDCVWIQWISMYLTDEEFCDMIRKLKSSPIILKENISKSKYAYDEEDASITRSSDVFYKLITTCGFKIMNEEYQNGLPDEIYKIKLMFLKHPDCQK